MLLNLKWGINDILWKKRWQIPNDMSIQIYMICNSQLIMLMGYKDDKNIAAYENFSFSYSLESYTDLLIDVCNKKIY